VSQSRGFLFDDVAPQASEAPQEIKPEHSIDRSVHMECGYRIDRRRYKRLQISLGASYEVVGPDYVEAILGHRQYDGRTLDFSAGGLAIETEHYMPTGTQLLITIAFFETNLIDSLHVFEPLRIYGEIRSMIQTGDNRFRIGIAFTHVDEKAGLRIMNILSSPLQTREPEIYELNRN
jgi:c-di-GMP-binding flagellar brake protein YcgR